MRKGKVVEKFKRILISIMCVVTLVFAMPVKAEAGIVADFVNLLLGIPDAIMWGMNQLIAKTDSSTSIDMDFKGWGGKGYIYNFEVTPYRIFSSGNYNEGTDPNTGEEIYETDLGLFDVNFFSDREIKSNYIVSSNILKYAIGNIYKYLRNLCLVLMMLVLLYIGIKIIISSTSQQQSKYKQMLTDWLVGMCLLLMMHYIMSFLMNINTTIVKMLSNDEGDSYYIGLADLQDNGKGTDSSWLDIAKGYKPWGWGKSDDEKRFFGKKIIVKNTDDDTDGFNVGSDGYVDLSTQPYIMHVNRTDSTVLENWGKDGKLYLSAVLIDNDNPQHKNRAIYKANLMEYTRTISNFGFELIDNVFIYSDGNLQSLSAENDGLVKENIPVFAYSILYLALVVETVMFTVVYIKRVLQLAMLTMIAPLVAFMYPIDKIGDGQAQAFNTWLKDYIFNILIQPLHLLLYTIFIVAASDLFQKNMIYAIAIYAFMIPAEKYFKKIFGFDKASSGGGGPLGGVLGAGMAMHGLNRLTGLGPPGPPGGGKTSSDGGSGSGKKPKISKLKPPKESKESKEPKGDGTNQLPGSLPEKAKNFGKRVFHGAKENIGSKFNTGRNRIAKAATGGKYNRLIGRKGAFKAAAKHIGGSAVKQGGKLIAQGAGRGFSMVTRGTIGLMAGAATAISTGDVNNLTKGVSIGLASGWNNGGKIANSTIGAVGRFSDDAKAWRAENDEEYAKKLRRDEARVAFQDASLDDKQYEALDELSPYIDFDGDVDKLDAAMEARNNGATLEEIKQAESDSKSWKDLKTKSDHESYLKFQTNQYMQNIQDSEIDETIDQAQIEKQAKLEKEAKIAEAEKKREETANKYDEKIAAAKQRGNKERVKELEKKAYRDDQACKKELEDAQKAKYDKVTAEKNLREQKKQELAQQRAEEDYQRALDFQQKSKKTSK